MNLEQINKLDPTQQARYMAFERCFETDGWRLIVEHLQQRADDAAQRELNAKSWEENRVWHGARAVLLQIANLADITEAEFAGLAAAAADAQQTEDEEKYE